MIVLYEDKYEGAWDRFVLEESINGTFLQSRKFLNYHPGSRFKDASFMVMKGNNIVAAVPACVIEQNTKLKLISHMGSTFGGIILGKEYKKVAEIENIFSEMEIFFKERKYEEVTFKMTSWLYGKDETEVLEYFLSKSGYIQSLEIGYYINFEKYNTEMIEQNFNASRRRGYRKSIGHNMKFGELHTKEELADFYRVLCDNMKKFDTIPVHSLEELTDLWVNRIPQNVRFFGLKYENKMIAGSMVFSFEKKVFHTQYLACDQNYLELYPSEALYYDLIRQAVNECYEYISFGTSTLEHGTVLNKTLAQFKEGFGTREYVNRTYRKMFK